MLDYNDQLEPCPICGRKAYVAHIYDAYDMADFGWDAGCPVAKLGDGVHGFEWGDEINEDFPRVSMLLCKQDAVTAWNKWAVDWRDRHNGN